MNDIKTENRISKLEEQLDSINFKLHDNRRLLIKIVSQSEDLLDAFECMHNLIDNFILPDGLDGFEKHAENLPNPLYIKEYRSMAEVIHEKIMEFKQFEKELERYKDELIPGSMGEA